MKNKGINIIIKSLLTEKSTNYETNYNTVTFIVNKNLIKPEIVSAVEGFSGCKVKSVRTINMLGKTKTNRKTGKKILPKVVKKCYIRLDDLSKFVGVIQSYSSKFMKNQFGGGN
jgi:ribosomal protein L23